MRLLSLGDRVARGRYGLLTCYGRAANYAGPAGFISVVSPRVGAGPVNLVVSEEPVPRAESVRVAGGAVWLGARRLPTGDADVYSSGVRAIGLDPGTSAREIAALESALVRWAPARSMAFVLDGTRLREFRTTFERALAAGLAAGARLLVQGEMAEAARRLGGCGFGLTPSGDDFLCGFLIGLNAMDARSGGRFTRSIATIRGALAGETAMVRTFLELSAAGRAHSSVGNLLRVLVGRGAGRVPSAVAEVLAHGATSGADLAVGLVGAFRHAVLGTVAAGTRRAREEFGREGARWSF